MVGKQAARDLDKEHEYLRYFLDVLRWEWRQRKAAEAVVEDAAAAGPDDPESCA